MSVLIFKKGQGDIMKNDNKYWLIKVNKKIALSLVIVLVTSFMSAICFHLYSTVETGNIPNYSQKNSKVDSDAFSLIYVYDTSNIGIDYNFSISGDLEKNNELFIFNKADKHFFEHIGIANRNKPYMNVTSDKAVSSLNLNLKRKQDANEYPALLYYSNNKDKIAKCTYQKNTSDGISDLKTETIAQNYPFAIIIPCGENTEIVNVSFYDKENNLIFEDNKL